ncbi:unnamed protein product [Polarella glacialis]|uniref:C3H1-type domain-containing protein n=1 Tax=Polarella glacialis TaxID=89957 RepID=A0A813GY04_POLGL|nr:unnamed protein product [Polarella glacialis]
MNELSPSTASIMSMCENHGASVLAATPSVASVAGASPEVRMLRRDLRRADSSFRRVADEAAEGTAAVLPDRPVPAARVSRAAEYVTRRQTMTIEELAELTRVNRRAGAEKTRVKKRLQMEQQAAEKHAKDEQAAMQQEQTLPNTAFGAALSARPGAGGNADVARWNADGARGNADGARWNADRARGNADGARWNAAGGQMCPAQPATICQVCQSVADGTMIACARCHQYAHLHCVVAIPNAVVCAYCYQMYSVEQNMRQQQEQLRWLEHQAMREAQMQHATSYMAEAASSTGNFVGGAAAATVKTAVSAGAGFVRGVGKMFPLVPQFPRLQGAQAPGSVGSVDLEWGLGREVDLMEGQRAGIDGGIPQRRLRAKTPDGSWQGPARPPGNFEAGAEAAQQPQCRGAAPRGDPGDDDDDEDDDEDELGDDDVYGTPRGDERDYGGVPFGELTPMSPQSLGPDQSSSSAPQTGAAPQSGAFSWPQPISGTSGAANLPMSGTLGAASLPMPGTLGSTSLPMSGTLGAAGLPMPGSLGSAPQSARRLRVARSRGLSKGPAQCRFHRQERWRQVCVGISSSRSREKQRYRAETVRQTMLNYGYQRPLSSTSSRKSSKNGQMEKRLEDMQQQMLSQAAAFEHMMADAVAQSEEKSRRLQAELESRTLQWQQEQSKASERKVPSFDPWQDAGRQKTQKNQDETNEARAKAKVEPKVKAEPREQTPPRTPTRSGRSGDVPGRDSRGHRRREDPDPDYEGDEDEDDEGDAWGSYHKGSKKSKKKKNKGKPGDGGDDGGDFSSSDGGSSSSDSSSSDDDRRRRPRQPAQRPLMRVKAETEWLKYDNMDAYYDIQEFFGEYERVKGLASQGLGFPPQDELQLLRGAFSGAPATEFKTFVDYDDERVRVLNTGSQKEQRGLLRAVKDHMLMEFHRPLVERQKRAKAEFETNSMRLSPQLAYAEFQAEFKKTVGNLRRTKVPRDAADLRLEFVSRLSMEAETHVNLYQYLDSVSKTLRPVETLEEVMDIARNFFRVGEAQNAQYAAEEINGVWVKGGGKGKGKGKDKGKSGGKNGKEKAKNNGDKKTVKCFTCGGNHFARDCLKKDSSKGRQGTVEDQDAVNDGGTKQPCFRFRDTGSCKYGDKCHFEHDKSKVRLQNSVDGASGAAGEDVQAVKQKGAEVPQSRKKDPVLTVEECDSDAESLEAEEDVEEIGATFAARAANYGVKKFSDISNLVWRPRPKVGRNQRVAVWLGGKKYIAVKDTGASVTTIRERIALEVVNKAIEKRDLVTIVECAEYDTAVKLQGFAASQVIEVKYAIVLRTSFQDIKGRMHPVDIEYRVIPNALDSGGNILLGASTVGPEGLDIQTTKLYHHFVGLGGFKCDRAELGNVAGRKQAAVDEALAVLDYDDGVFPLRLLTEELHVEPGEASVAYVSLPAKFNKTSRWLKAVPGGPTLVEGPVGADQIGVVSILVNGDEAHYYERGAVVATLQAGDFEMLKAVGVVDGRKDDYDDAGSTTAGEDELVALVDDDDGPDAWDEVEQIGEVIFEKEPAPPVTDETYNTYKQTLASAFPEANKDVSLHLAGFWGLLITAESNGVSFKHTKSQLCATKLALLGNIVGREGIEPDLERIRALMRWPAPSTKGQLREFFGSIGWVRPFLGTGIAHAAHGLRKLLKKQVPEEFGSEYGQEQTDSFESLKKLAAKYCILSTPDWEAARQWETTGRPFEVFLDAALYGAGAVLCQLDPELRKHRAICFISKSFTPTQQAWPAWTRELWAMKTASAEFASITAGFHTILWTDHRNNCRISHMPPEEAGEKTLRWWGQVLRSGNEVRFLAGKVNMGDGISRNPEDREAVLARRKMLLKDPVALEKAFSKEEFENENVVNDFDVAERPSTARSLWLDETFLCDDVPEEIYAAAVDGVPQIVLPVMIVPTWEGGTPADVQDRLFTDHAYQGPEVGFKATLADHAFQTDEDEGTWFSFPRGFSEKLKKKALRKQMMTAVIDLLRQITRSGTRVLVAHGQGRAVAALAASPALRAACYTSRLVLADEVARIETAWYGVLSVTLVKPSSHPRNNRWAEIMDSMPEIEGRQIAKTLDIDDVATLDGYRGFPAMIRIFLPKVLPQAPAWMSFADENYVECNQNPLRACELCYVYTRVPVCSRCGMTICTECWSNWSDNTRMPCMCQLDPDGTPGRVANVADENYVANFANENFADDGDYVVNFANDDLAEEDYTEGLSRALAPRPGQSTALGKEFGEISFVGAQGVPGPAVGPGQTEEQPVAAREPTLVGGKWRASLAAAQQRDTWTPRMARVTRWAQAGSDRAKLADYELLGTDVQQLVREAEHFVMSTDGLLLHRRDPRHVQPGEPAAVPVLPQEGSVPAALTPGGSGDKRWTWRVWGLYQAHTSMTGGHLMLERALPRLRTWCWRRSMSSDLERYVDACRGCLAMRGKPSVQITRIEHTRVPFDLAQIDLKGPIVPQSEEVFRFVLTMICVYTRYVFLTGLNTKTKRTEFLNALVAEILAIMQVRHKISPAYTPHVNAIVERSHQSMAMMLAILVLQHVREHLVLWGRFLPVVQYFMRHAQISRSGVSAFTCWHGWAGVDPSQRAIAPWQDVMLDMSVDEWVRDLIVGCKKVHERFNVFLTEAEQASVRQRDLSRRTKVVSFHVGDLVMLQKTPAEGGKSQIFLEHNECPFVIVRVINDYRCVIGPTESGPTPPRGGEEVSVGRLLKIPPPCELADEAGLPTPPQPPPLSEDKRRAFSHFPYNCFICWRHRNGTVAVGQVRNNFYRQNKFSVCEMGSEPDGSWMRLFLTPDGEYTSLPHAAEAIAEVQYLDVVGKVSFNRDGKELDQKSKRLLEAVRRPVRRVQVDAAVAFVDKMLVVAEAADVVVDGVFLTPDSKTKVSPRGLDADEKEKVAKDEVIFPDRSSLRYAQYVAHVTLELLRKGEPGVLSATDVQMVVSVCVWNRQSLWCDGAEYIRIAGCKFEVNTGDASPVTAHPYRKSPEEAALGEWHISKGLVLGTLKPHQKGKPQGRLVCDYRRLNAITKRHYHPMPRIDTVLRAAAGAYFYTGLDAVSGFNQLELTENARERLAITTPSGLYCWTVLPFGPVDGPQAFQSAMRRIFGGVQNLLIYGLFGIVYGHRPGKENKKAC